MNSSTDKPAKQQGPIRFGAVIPLTIVVGLVAVYFSLFFDIHLRHWIERAATQANGAEVNVGRVQTSFLKASVLIAGLQFTDPEQPEQNRIEIGEIRFRMLWDALLRGKIVIDEAVVEDVQIGTSRQRRGYVLPPEPVEPDDGPSLKDQMFARLKQEFSGNVLGDLAAMAAGAAPAEQLKDVGDDLASRQFLDEFRQLQDEMERQWDERIKAMPKGEDFQRLRTRLSDIRLKDFRDIQEVQNTVSELQTIRDEANAKAGVIVDADKSLKGDIEKLRASYAELEKKVREDVHTLQSRLHMPSLDAATLSRGLFGLDILDKLRQGRNYLEQVRRYLPPKKSSAPERNVRHKGRNYSFGRPAAYPRFWLRRAAVNTTRPDKSGLMGEILDLATDQSVVGRPMRVLLQGDFPQQGIRGVNVGLVIDRLQEEPIERFEFGVAHYPVGAHPLVQGGKVRLGMTGAEASSAITAELRGDNVDIRFGTRFDHVGFDIAADQELVRELLVASLAGLERVKVEAGVHGSWGNLEFDLASDLGSALVRGMGQYLQARIDQARERIQKMVEARIAEQRQHLQGRRDEFESRYRTLLAERQSQIEKLKSEIEEARRELERRKAALIENQKQRLKQEANKLLNQWVR